MKPVFDITRASRKLMVQLLEKYPLQTINRVPEGFNNNIVWNIAHVIAVQEAITYGLSGLRWTAPKELVKGYARGTKPETAVGAEFVTFLKNELLDSIDRLEANYFAGIFKEYTSYDFPLGYTATSIEDALHFNQYHEALHMGAINNIRISLDGHTS